MIKNLYFGQYKHKKSLVHAIDPRLKLLYIVFLSILIFFIKDTGGILIFSLFVMAVILLSRLGVKDLLQNLRPFLLIFVFIFMMYLLFSRSQLMQGLIAIWRFLMLILVSSILTSTTTISDLVIAIERLSNPLKILNFKPRNIAVMISMAIRFIPMVLINLEKLKEAMLIRLANLRKLRYINLILLALLERLLKSASNLNDAMQSRLYNENAESHKIMRFGMCDYASFALISAFVVAMSIY